MSEILSQEEIDQLLAMAQEPSVTETPVIEEPGYVRYDFRQPSKLSRDQIRSLQRINEQFARAFSGLMSARLRSRVDISLESVEKLSFGEFINSLANPSVICIYGINEESGNLILQMSTDIAFLLYDRLCGGPGRIPEKARELTEIEMAVLHRQFIAELIDTLELAWQDVASLGFTLQTTESNPQFLQVMAEREAVILNTMLMDIDGTEEMVNLCFSQSALEPILKRITQRRLLDSTKRTTEVDLGQMRERIAMAELPIEVELGQATLTMQDLLQLQRGDIVPLDRGPREKLEVKVGQITKFLASPGKIGKKLGAVITDLCPREGSKGNAR
ncbi:MAG: flagellar motor switch protein FliM [Limnochordia bacterium]|jgi:flagellar motor switch protein FliM